MNFWPTLWAPLRSWMGGRQASGKQIAGPESYPSRSAVAVTEETALQVSAVWACVRLISQTVASLPIIVYRRTATGREQAPDHWFAQLMANGPNIYQTRYEYWEHQIANLALHGNMYARKVTRGGRIVGLLPLNPLQVETALIKGAIVHQFAFDGGIEALSAASVWHARMNGDYLVGRSPLQFGRNIIGVAQAAEQSVTEIYRDGGKRSGVLMLDKLLKPEQRDQVRANFAGLVEGEQRLMVLEAGAKFEAVAMSPQDIELLASRRFQVEEICRWFGVPSVLVNDTSGSTTWGSGIEQIVGGFYKLNLRPYLEALENSIQTHLFSDADRAGFEVEFDFEGLLRADQKTRFEGYRTGIQAGVLTPNEARAMEWLPAKEGGDQLYMQGATLPIEKLGQQAQAQTTDEEPRA